MKLVKLTWMDHVSFTKNNWHDKEDLEKLSPTEFNTVGWVIHETKDYITLVSTKTTDDEGPFAGEFTIVKKAVIKKETLDEDST